MLLVAAVPSATDRPVVVAAAAADIQPAATADAPNNQQAELASVAVDSIHSDTTAVAHLRNASSDVAAVVKRP